MLKAVKMLVCLGWWAFSVLRGSQKQHLWKCRQGWPFFFSNYRANTILSLLRKVLGKPGCWKWCSDKPSNPRSSTPAFLPPKTWQCGAFSSSLHVFCGFWKAKAYDHVPSEFCQVYCGSKGYRCLPRAMQTLYNQNETVSIFMFHPIFQWVLNSA